MKPGEFNELFRNRTEGLDWKLFGLHQLYNSVMQ
jgi:hypothetical protein